MSANELSVNKLHRPLRIAIGAFMLESNANAPVATRGEFESSLYLAGPEFEFDWRQPEPRSPICVRGFVQAMDKITPWNAVPLVATAVGASGPVDQAFFDEMLDEMLSRLRQSMPVDAVYLCLHGAAIGTTDVDPDGTVLARVRKVVGKNIPIVATLDLHGNIVQRMVDEADVLIAYLTNPHIDMLDRGAEAALVITEMLSGMKPTAAFVKLPLAPPSVTLNTGSGPYGDLVRYGQSLVDDRVLNVSILCGFTLGDTPKNGMSVVVTTRNDKKLASELALQIAQRAWAERARYVPQLVSIDEATRLAKSCGDDASTPALLFADVADNAGGGGRANTVWILKSFVEAGVRNALVGVMFDAALAQEANQLGEGTDFLARFNRDEDHPLSGKFEARARVSKLHDGHTVGRRGIYQGTKLYLGPSALLTIGEIQVVVVSRRYQCADPVMFEMFDIAITAARSVLVKSRGHFRAGFDLLFTDKQIIDVDAPGLTTPVLANVHWKHMPRPMFPLDPDTQWVGANVLV